MTAQAALEGMGARVRRLEGEVRWLRAEERRLSGDLRSDCWLPGREAAGMVATRRVRSAVRVELAWKSAALVLARSEVRAAFGGGGVG